MQSAILLSFVASSSLPPCRLQSTHPLMPCYISPYIVYNIYGTTEHQSRGSPSNSDDWAWNKCMCAVCVPIFVFEILAGVGALGFTKPAISHHLFELLWCVSFCWNCIEPQTGYFTKQKQKVHQV